MVALGIGMDWEWRRALSTGMGKVGEEGMGRMGRREGEEDKRRMGQREGEEDMRRMGQREGVVVEKAFVGLGFDFVMTQRSSLSISRVVFLHFGH